MTSIEREHVNTLVIGGGQAGLAVGYHLSRARVPFLIVDANERTGDSWRRRWDSLRLFTPNRFNSLPGMPIPGEDWAFPTKDELADYLESYARHFELPIRHGARVERLMREGDGFVALAGGVEYEAVNVVVAMASYQKPSYPPIAEDLDPSIVQLHAADYRSPAQLPKGATLVVGMGNSGAEIAKELIDDRPVFISGDPSAVQPFRPEGLSGRLLMPFVGRVIFNRVLTTSTPMGRKARSKMVHKAAPLMRVKPRDLVQAGAERVGRITGVARGYPQADDGTVLEVAAVVWATGYRPGFDWIDLPVFDSAGDVVHDRGVVESEPGLYFVGLKFLYSVLSDTLLAIGRDSGHVVDHLVSRSVGSLTTTAA